MREYETTIIIQPEISAEGTQTLLAKMDSVLARGKSVRLMCADLGKRKLAYEIRKFHKGHYYTLSFCDVGQVVPDLERNLRMEESVLRFMTVLVDDEVTDVETRQARGRDLETEQKKRAVEKAEREAEEARAREEVERLGAEERLRTDASDDDSDDVSDDVSDDEDDEGDLDSDDGDDSDGDDDENDGDDR